VGGPPVQVGMRRILGVTIVIAAVWAASAAADGGGPSPGPTQGGPGKVDPSGQERYVAVPAKDGTLVEAIRVRDGSVMRWKYLDGQYGVPMIAYDGSLGGLSHDGSQLVVASFPGAHDTTSFVMLDPMTMRVRARVRLRGVYAFDALSPDGSLMYLIQYLGARGAAAQPYAVRVFAWDALRLLPGEIVDPREPDEKMNGEPDTRASTPGGWAYTLYWRPGKSPFVHALDTVHRRAYCVDLPWKSPRWIYEVRLRIRGGTLDLRRKGKTIARLDRKTLDVSLP
jgi:hypothetical protein